MDTERVRTVAEKHRAALDKIAALKAECKAVAETAKQNFELLVSELWSQLGQELKEFCDHYNGHFDVLQLYCDLDADRITVKAPSVSATLTLKLSRAFRSLSVQTNYGHRVDLLLRAQSGSLTFVLNGREDVSPEDVAHTLATVLAERVVTCAEGNNGVL
jgi:hypothetical protein